MAACPTLCEGLSWVSPKTTQRKEGAELTHEGLAHHRCWCECLPEHATRRFQLLACH